MTRPETAADIKQRIQILSAGPIRLEGTLEFSLGPNARETKIMNKSHFIFRLHEVNTTCDIVLLFIADKKSNTTSIK